MSQPKCKVLFIDDHEDTSEMLSLLLAHEDYDVMTAGSIREAIELTKTNEFDLFVLDKHLPDGSGVDLCKQLNELSPDVPCIFYTGDAYAVHRSEAMAAGADAYVAKPDIEGLLSTINQFLAERQCAAAT